MDHAEISFAITRLPCLANICDTLVVPLNPSNTESNFNGNVEVAIGIPEDPYVSNNDISKIARYLLDCIWLDDMSYYPEFLGTRIVLCEPEFSSFNALVRERLDEGEVYYVKVN